MANSWNQSYTELKEFICEHPSIEFDKEKISIPAQVRPHFYQLFDKARESFIENYFQGLLEESRILSKHYQDIEQELTTQLALDDIRLDDELQRFLHDPLNQLVRTLPDFLFDLLKGKVSDDDFYQMSAKTLKQSFDNLNNMGYKQWILVSLLKLLHADELFQVDVERASFRDYVANATYTIHKPSPIPKNVKCISNKYLSEVCFAVPDWIVHSSKINTFVSSISKLPRPGAIANDRYPQREWRRYSDLNIFDSDMSLLYMSSNPKGISLVADQLYICRPDLLLITRTSDKWDDKVLGDIMVAHQFLNPALGTHIMLKTQISFNDDLANQGIHFINIGFDQTRLDSIVDTLEKHAETITI